VNPWLLFAELKLHLLAYKGILSRALQTLVKSFEVTELPGGKSMSFKAKPKALPTAAAAALHYRQ
jgi:hypothetical protein